MSIPVYEMEKILKKENDLYNKIYSIEKEKSDAIFDRNGNKIKKLSLDQEIIIQKISVLESRREKEIEKYKISNNLEDITESLSLKDIVRSMDEDSAHHLLRLGMELKDNLIKLHNLQIVNKKMISVNMEFYNILLSNLKENNSGESGYGNNGKEDSVNSNPVFVNKTA